MQALSAAYLRFDPDAVVYNALARDWNACVPYTDLVLPRWICMPIELVAAIAGAAARSVIGRVLLLCIWVLIELVITVARAVARSVN
jgi:hypothetical protein